MSKNSQSPSLRENGASADNTAKSNVERIEDPNDYNLRRRLKQILDAKEAVVERKDDAVELFRENKRFSRADRDRFVVEKLVDYIHELLPLLDEADLKDEFLSEDVGRLDDEPVTIEDIVDGRGYISDNARPWQRDADGRYIPYQLSMDARHICDRYYKQVAGVTFEQNSTRPEDNPVDPAGRFNDE